MRTTDFDIVIIGTRRRRRHDGARAGRRPARASSCSSAATSCRRKTRTGARRRSGRTCATAPTERWLDERGERVPAVHALRRRRQYEVLGQRALPAAPRGLRRDRSTPTACRRRGRSTTTTLAPYYDRAERLYHVHGEAGARSDRAAARAVSVSADSARARHGGDRRAAAARRGCTRRRCRSA